MNDYLREFCEAKNMGLMYRDSNTTVLSYEIDNDMIIIKASKIFEYCPREVAEAVVNYYAGSGYEQENMSVIKNYLSENLISTEYNIKPPDKALMALTENNNVPAIEVEDEPQINYMEEAYVEKSAEQYVQDEDNEKPLTEIDISSMTIKNFWGKSLDIKPDKAFTASDDDVVELDIVVDHYVE